MQSSLEVRSILQTSCMFSGRPCRNCWPGQQSLSNSLGFRSPRRRVHSVGDHPHGNRSTRGCFHGSPSKRIQFDQITGGDRSRCLLRATGITRSICCTSRGLSPCSWEDQDLWRSIGSSSDALRRVALKIVNRILAAKTSMKRNRSSFLIRRLPGSKCRFKCRLNQESILGGVIAQ
jgi:hypothetical protein